MKSLVSLFLLFPMLANFAIAGPYPVPTSIIQTVEAGSVNYDVVWSVVEIPAADQPLPMERGYMGTAVKIGYGTSRFMPGMYFNEGCYKARLCTTRTLPGETISSAAMRAYNLGQTNGIISDSGSGSIRIDDPCVGYLYVRNDIARWDEAIMPGNTCVRVPPAVQFCKITTPNLILDHGQISLSNANGSMTSEMVNINCTSATKVTLRLGSDINYVPLQNNGKAIIAVNDQTVGRTYDFPTGDTQIEVSSTLSDIVDVGDYSGSTVMVVEPI